MIRTNGTTVLTNCMEEEALPAVPTAVPSRKEINDMTLSFYFEITDKISFNRITYHLLSRQELNAFVSVIFLLPSKQPTQPYICLPAPFQNMI